jgi:hypothetical protein
MGQELICKARIGRKQAQGKALLETSELIFRPVDTDGLRDPASPGELRLRIPFSDMKNVSAERGVLQVKFGSAIAAFQIGAYAEKWRDKILHPKTRIEKLGVKPGANVTVVGPLPQDFVQELLSAVQRISEGSVSLNAQLIFLAVDTLSDLIRVEKLARQMPPVAGLWIVYPKGRTTITQNDVIAAGRKAGMKDVKVVGFSETHTALKFVIPVEKR